MTHEQTLRGPDKAIPWMVILTAYDDAVLERAVCEHLDPEAFRNKGASGEIVLGTYGLHYTATAEEVARTNPFPVLTSEKRRSDGPRY